VLGFRSESAIRAGEDMDGLRLKGKVLSILYNGRDSTLLLKTSHGEFHVNIDARGGVMIGDEVNVLIPFGDLCPFG
jgi:hypothetical protein